MTDTEDRRTKRVLKKLGPGGYFKVPIVLDSKEFKKGFALDHGEMSSSGVDNAEGKTVDDTIASVGDEGSLAILEMTIPEVKAPEMNQ